MSEEAAANPSPTEQVWSMHVLMRVLLVCACDVPIPRDDRITRKDIHHHLPSACDPACRERIEHGSAQITVDVGRVAVGQPMRGGSLQVEQPTQPGLTSSSEAAVPITAVRLLMHAFIHHPDQRVPFSRTSSAVIPAAPVPIRSNCPA